MLFNHLAALVFAGLHAVSAQSSTSGAGSVASSSTATATSAVATKSLGVGESIVIVPTFVSSLSAIITTTYTTTFTTASTEAASRPTGLPSSLYCDDGYAEATGPFCYPHNGTQQIKGKTYSVTWNYEYAPNCTDVYIALQYLNNENLQQVTSTQETNLLGFWNYTVKSEWLNGKSSQYAQFQIIPFNCGGSGTVDPSAGPIIELLKKAPVIEESKSTPKAEILGLSIGLPLAVAAFIGVALFVMWWNKGHRHVPNFVRRKKGYTGRRQRGVKLADLAENPAGTEAYRDHPEDI